MSSILLTNPFLTVPSVSHSATEGLAVPATLNAVAPAQSGGDARSAGDASSHTGTGSGQGRSPGSASQQAVLTDLRGPLSSGRPPNATANSVVSAQSSDGAAPTGPKADVRDTDLRRESVRLAVPEPVIKAEMPDPLPTLPFLKMMSGRS